MISQFVADDFFYGGEMKLNKTVLQNGAVSGARKRLI